MSPTGRRVVPVIVFAIVLIALGLMLDWTPAVHAGAPADHLAGSAVGDVPRP